MSALRKIGPVGRHGLLMAGFLVAAGLLCLTGGEPANAQTKKAPPATIEPFPDVLVNSAGTEQVGYINELVEKNWKANKVEPSERCTDSTFIRRASLDIIGRIAKVHEIQQYMKDPPRERRSLLIERLLASEEFAQNLGSIWTVHLLTRSGSTPLHQEQLRDWLSEKLTEKKNGTSVTYAPDWAHITTELLTASGKTNENGATNFILHHMGEPIASKDRNDLGAYDMVPLTSRTTKLFLGLRTQCVQCHDHPFQGEWNQGHFWGINAFYRQADAPNGRPGAMVMPKKGKGILERQFELSEDTRLNPKGLVFYERRNTLIITTDATFLDGRKVVFKAGESRRKELARLVTTSPYFSKAFINRTWGHFFGKSFTKDAVDDFGDHNPVTNPELLDRLAKDWAEKYNHNPKDLIRWICNSRAYGLSSVANKTNDKPEDEVLFSRMLLKSMSPEQLFESLMTATQAKVAQSKEARNDLRQEWLKKLISNFGDDEGNEVSFNGTVVQALMLINGKDINDAIMDQKDGTVANILRRTDLSHKVAIDSVFMAALNRMPTAREYTKLLDQKMIMYKADIQSKIPLKTEREQAAFWAGYYQDVMWAVLNSSEFILNH